MKNLLSILAGLATILLLIPAQINAQAMASKTMSGNTMLVDNSAVMAYEWSLFPGDKTDTHTHAAHFIYVLEGGKIEVHFTDGKKEIYELSRGLSEYFPAEGAHYTVNIGKTAVKAIIVELKDYPYEPTKEKGKERKKK